MATPDQGGLTRRDVIKRAGVIGAVWSVPTILSAQAPAAAASGTNLCAGTCGGTVNGTPCPVCAAGSGPCTQNSQCAAGTVCSGGVCVIPYGSTAPCTSLTQCQSGNCSGPSGSPANTCLAAWPGTTCATDSNCLSGKCTGGRCFETFLGQSCRASADCTDNTMCSGSPGTCGGNGATCQNNQKCVSGKCRNGICVAV